jgi:hypothetical protein
MTHMTHEGLSQELPKWPKIRDIHVITRQMMEHGITAFANSSKTLLVPSSLLRKIGVTGMTE